MFQDPAKVTDDNTNIHSKQKELFNSDDLDKVLSLLRYIEIHG